MAKTNVQHASYMSRSYICVDNGVIHEGIQGTLKQDKASGRRHEVGFDIWSLR